MIWWTKHVTKKLPLNYSGLWFKSHFSWNESVFLLLALGNLRRKAKEFLQHNNTIHCKSVPAGDIRKQGARPNQHLFVNSRNVSNIWGQFPDRVMMVEGSGITVRRGMMDLVFGSVHIQALISLHFKWLSFTLFQQEWQKSEWTNKANSPSSEPHLKAELIFPFCLFET